MKKKHKHIVAILNIIGGVGYVINVLQWFWLAMIFLPGLLKSQLLKDILLSTHETPNPPPPEPVVSMSLPLPFTIAIWMLAGVVIVIGIYVIFVVLPKSVARTGTAVTHTPATVIAPVILRRAHLPEKQKRELPALIIVTVKAILVLVPWIVLYAAPLEPSQPLPLNIVTGIGAVLCAVTGFLFAAQYAFSRIYRLDYKTLR